MKNFIIAILATLAIPAFAQHHHHGYHHYRNGYSSGWNWVVPAVIGGAVVYGITRQQAQPPMIYIPQGYPPPPAGYRYEQILDAGCNCYRWVLVQQ